jgi:hypothetical protein
LDRNAILRPSGDQIGSELLPVVVRRCSSVPSTLATKMSVLFAARCET